MEVWGKKSHVIVYNILFEDSHKKKCLMHFPNLPVSDVETVLNQKYHVSILVTVLFRSQHILRCGHQEAHYIYIYYIHIFLNPDKEGKLISFRPINQKLKSKF